MDKIVEEWRATQDDMRHDLRSLFQGAVRLALELVLEGELKAMVGARRFERVGSRKDHRNGTYMRRLLTSMGQIDVQVPRSHEHVWPVDVIGRYRTRLEEFPLPLIVLARHHCLAPVVQARFRDPQTLRHFIHRVAAFHHCRTASSLNSGV